MWAGFLHLAIGNALIGVGEGLLLSWFFGIRKARTISVMVAANYFSAWLGAFLICRWLVPRLPMDLNNGWTWFWAMVGLVYVATLILELPFVAWCIRRGGHTLRQSIRASVVIQSLSYILLFGWYFLASSTSLYTQATVVTPAELSLPATVLVYFIDPSGQSVNKRLLAEGTDERVCDLAATNRNDRLFVRPNAIHTNNWDLVAWLSVPGEPGFELQEVLTNLTVEAAPDARIVSMDPPRFEGSSFNFGKVEPLGSATNTPWTFWAGFWAAEGLRITHKAHGLERRVAYETPFGAWTVRNAVQLPTDKVLFQLGDDQICAFDPEKGLVALLWRGKGPVPVIPR
jgi:hypothetical protein